MGQDPGTPRRLQAGTRIYRGWRRVADKAFTVALRGSFEGLGPGTVLQPPLRVEGEHRIIIGSGVFIGAGSWLQTLEEAGAPPGRLTIGDRARCSGMCVISAAAEITLGRAVLLGRNVVIVDHNHASADGAVAIADQGIDRIRPVSIGDGAWLAQNVVVCPGVSIGANAVVAANSVVTQDVPPHALAAGAPARVVRDRRPSDV